MLLPDVLACLEGNRYLPLRLDKHAQNSSQKSGVGSKETGDRSQNSAFKRFP